MCDPSTPDPLLEAVRRLHVANPGLGLKPLRAKLQKEQPDLGAGTREVREALTALKAESEAAKAAAAPPAVKEGGACSNAALSLACIGCLRLPSDMGDDREKHPICDMCRDQKLPTTYLCGKNCPANPGAWKKHGAFHKVEKKQRKRTEPEDGGVAQQVVREAAERQARRAAQSGDKYDELLAEVARYASKHDWRKAARACREAIALRPDEPTAYYHLGGMLSNAAHCVEAAQRFLEARERCDTTKPVGSEYWAKATAQTFDLLMLKECAEVAKPEWWNDEELKALSARVVRAVSDDGIANSMRAVVLSGLGGDAWGVGPRSAAELKEAATYYERAAALCGAPVVEAEYTSNAVACRRKAEAACPWPM